MQLVMRRSANGRCKDATTLFGAVFLTLFHEAWCRYGRYWHHSVVRWWAWLSAPVAVTVAVKH